MPKRRDDDPLLVSDGQRITGPGSTVSTFAIDLHAASPSVFQKQIIIDEQYQRAVKALEEERDRDLQPWDRKARDLLELLEKDTLKPSDRKDRQSDLRRTQRELLRIVTRFWRATEEAYFECRLRNWNRLEHGPGRRPKDFHWFRTVPTGQNRTAEIIERVRVRVVAEAELHRHRLRPRDVLVDILWEEIPPSSAEHRRLLHTLDSYEETSRSTRSARAKAVRSLDPPGFDRLERAVDRALEKRAR